MHRPLERVRGHNLTDCKLEAHSELKPAEGRGNCLQDATPWLALREGDVKEMGEGVTESLAHRGLGTVASLWGQGVHQGGR